MFHLKPYLNTSAPAHLCNLLTSVTRRENKQCALNSNCPELRKYVVSRDHTHVFGVELIHLLLNFALTFRVDGQEVAGEGQRAAAGFVAREQEDKRLAHDLILSYHLFGPPGGGLLWGKPVDQIRGRRFRLRIAGGISRVKVFQRHALLAGSSVQHQLKEVPTPLHATTKHGKKRMGK